MKFLSSACFGTIREKNVNYVSNMRDFYPDSDETVAFIAAQKKKLISGQKKNP
jgi:hypothetical protein